MNLILRPLEDVNDVTWSIIISLIILLAGVLDVVDLSVTIVIVASINVCATIKYGTIDFSGVFIITEFL